MRVSLHRRSSVQSRADSRLSRAISFIKCVRYGLKLHYVDLLQTFTELRSVTCHSLQQDLQHQDVLCICSRSSASWTYYTAHVVQQIENRLTLVDIIAVTAATVIDAKSLAVD